MNVFVDLDLPGLEEALAEFLPAGIEPISIHFDRQRLRIEGRGPLGMNLALVARVETTLGHMTLSDLDFEGPVLANAIVSSKLRRSIADLDIVRGPFRVRGTSDGKRIVVAWIENPVLLP